MAIKRIYRKVYAADGTTLVSLVDELTTRQIPLDENNADYVEYLALGSSALALDAGAALPVGTTAGDLHPAPTFLPPLPPGYPPS